MSDNTKNKDNAVDASKAVSKGGGSAMRPEIIRLGIALLGGILVLNSYLAKVLFSSYVDPVAREFSAFIGALMLSLPIFWEAVCDLVKGKVHMNELVGLALLAAFAKGDYSTAGAVAFFMLIIITI